MTKSGMFDQDRRGSRWEQFGIIFYPLLFYQMLSIVLIMIGQGIFGGESTSYMACQTFMAAVAIPVMYFFFLRPDMAHAKPIYFADFEQQNNHNREILFSRGTLTFGAARNCLLCALIAVLIGTGLNNLILMSGLAENSQGYAQATENFYSGSALLSLLCSGILMPVLEEIVFRGILYGRIRRFLRSGIAMLLSALLFGILHFNIVQFLFAFPMGLLFTILLEKTGKLYTTMAAHMAVNILAVIRTQTGLLSTTVDGSLFAWITSPVFVLLGMAFLYFYAINMVRDLRDRIHWENELKASRRGK